MIRKLKFILICFLSLLLRQKVQGQNPNWVFNSRSFDYQMQFTASLKIDGLTLTNANDQVAVFVGDELRGLGNITFNSTNQKYVSFFSAYANTIGETLSFKIYDSTQDTVFEAVQTQQFVINEQVGGIFQSFVISNNTLNNQADITSFSFQGVEAVSNAKSGNEYNIVLPQGAAVNTLTPVFNVSSGANAFINFVKQNSNSTNLDFTNPVTYQVLSQNEKVLNEFTINVTVASSSAPPSTVLSSAENTNTNKKQIPTTLNFSEAISGLSDSDFITTNTVISNINQLNTTTYTATLTFINQGNANVYLTENEVINTNSIGNIVSNTLSFNYDNLQPILQNQEHFSEQKYFQITFSESVSNVTLSDFLLSGSLKSYFVLSDVQQISNAVYNINYTGITNEIGSLYVQIDNNSNISDLATNPIVKQNFETYYLNNNAAPFFENNTPNASNIVETSFTLNTDINLAGTIYYVILANNATAPNALEVKNGTGSSDASVIASGSAVTNSGDFSNTFTVTSLTKGTAYDIYVVAEDLENTPNLQANPSLVEVTLPKKSLPNGINMKDISGGVFTLGSNDLDGSTDQKIAAPEYQVTLSSFAMSEAEITNAQYVEFLNAAFSEGILQIITGDSGPDKDKELIVGSPTSNFNGEVLYTLDGIRVLKDHGNEDGDNNEFTGSVEPENPLNISYIGFNSSTQTFYVKDPFNVDDFNWNDICNYQDYGATPKIFQGPILNDFNDWAGAGLNYSNELQGWTENNPAGAVNLPTQAQVSGWPVTFIRWRGAKAFADFYNVNLPTEAQWEYAAKGGADFEYAVYDGQSVNDANWNQAGINSLATGHLRSAISGNANPFGLYNLAGNVWEWIADNYVAPYDTSIVIDPLIEENGSTIRSWRGGAWNYHEATLQSSVRFYDEEDRGNDHFGFRITGTHSATDAIAPVLNNLVLTNTFLGNSTSITYSATFSEAVTLVSIDDFILTKTGIANASIGTITTIDNISWEITITNITGDGTLRLDLKNSTNIQDYVSNGSPDAKTGDETHTVDNTNPVLNTLTINDTPLGSATAITYTVSFNEAVTLVSDDDFTLTTTGTATATIGTPTTSNNTTWEITITEISGDGTIRLDLNGSTNIIDASENGSPDAKTGDEIHTVDNTIPVLNSLTINDTPLSNATAITYTASFSEAVTLVSADDFILTTTETATAAIGTPTTSNNITWLIPISGISGRGTLRLDLKELANIQDEASNSVPLAKIGDYLHNVNLFPPTFTSLPTLSITEGDVYNYIPTVSDLDEDNISITATILPSWLSLNFNENGIVSTIAGSIRGYKDASVNEAEFNFPRAIASNSKGNIYVVDGNHTIREIGTNNEVTTFAGYPSTGNIDDTGTSARFHSNYGIAIDATDNLYLADRNNHRIRKISPSGVVTHFAGSTTRSSSYADGNSTSSRFRSPDGVAVDALGNVYVADTGNHSIRKISPSGDVSTIAGGTSNSSSGDIDGIASVARFNSPTALVVDTNGNIYVADSDNHKIRKIDTNGNVSTVAGNGDSGDVDEIGTAARFDSPRGITIDQFNNLYVADMNNNKIKKITPDGNVISFIGNGIIGDTDGNVNEAQLNAPRGVAIDNDGNLLIADQTNHKIRKVVLEYQLSGDSAEQTGNHNVTLLANDNNGNTTEQDFTIVVNAKCAAPTSTVTEGTLAAPAATELTLTGFTPPIDGADGYVIYMNNSNIFTPPTDGNTPTAVLSWNSSGQQAIYFGTSSTPNITVTNLEDETTYYFQIYAYNNCSDIETFETTGLNINETTLDATAPSFDVLNSTPNDNATSVAINRNIIIDFTEDIKIKLNNNGVIRIFDVAENSTYEKFEDADYDGLTSNPASGKFGILNDKIYLNPSSNLEYNTNYAVLVINFIEDNSGNNLANSFSRTNYNFKTVSIIWRGFTNTNWGTKSNWNTNELPTSTDDILVPGFVENKPIIGSNTNAFANSITIEPSSSITIAEGGSFTINGDLFNNGNNLTVNSSSSLIVKGSSTGNITYIRNLPSNNWYAITSPVIGQDIDSFVLNSNLATGQNNNIALGSYQNITNSWSYYQNGSTASGDFISGEGYITKLSNPGNIEFTGAMPTNDFSEISLLDNSESSGSAFNFIGNPYPSFISANTLLSDNDSGDNNLLKESTIWVWNESKDTYDTYNFTSDFYIAPTQGFFVKTDGVTNTFAIKETMQSHQSATFQKNSRPEINLEVTSGTVTRDTKIFYINGTTTEFDNGYDSTIFDGVNNNFSLYTALVDNNNGEKLAIQSLPNNNFDQMVIPIGLIADAGTIIFKVNEKNIPEGYDVYLEDKETTNFINLSINESECTVTLTDPIDGLGRFYLHLKLPIITWNGSMNTNWNNPSNWSTNQVPTNTDDIIIPNTTNKPIIRVSTNALARNITIQDLSSISISSGGSLIIEDNLSNNGNNLVIESGASLIVKGESSGNITYVRDLNSTNWYAIASPVIGQNIDSFVSNSNLAMGQGNNIALGSYLNTSNSWSYYQNGAINSGNFSSGTGHIIKPNTIGSIEFTGTMPTTDFLNINLTDNSLLSGSAFNLVGNPYPSFLSANSLLIANDSGDNDILKESTIWVWNQNKDSYDTYNFASNFYIAPTQGFFVKTNGNTNSFSISKELQSHQMETFQKNDKSQIELKVSNGIKTRTTDIYYLNNATINFDNGYDSNIFGGVTDELTFYTALVSNSHGEKLSIQSLPKTNYKEMVIPLGLTSSEGTIKFTINSKNLPDGNNLFLEDKITANFIDLTEPNASYTVTLDEPSDGIGRFYLHTKNNALDVNTHHLNKIKAYLSSKTNLIIEGIQTERSYIQLYDILGKIVFKSTLNSNNLNSITLPILTNGTYILRINSNHNLFHKKILIK